MNGNKVQTAVTDDTGLAKFIDVEYGKYYVKESRPPNGYTISDEELSVDVNGIEDGKSYEAGTITDEKIRASETQSFTVKDQRITNTLPKTGGIMDFSVLLIAGLIIILSGTWLLFTSKKAKDN